MESKIIAVDFDGTIVEDAYPAIGKPMLFAFDTLKKFEQEGYRLILWAYRIGKYLLQDAIAFCKKNGLTFYAVNDSFENESYDRVQSSHKIQADIFINDRNLIGFPEWGVVYQIIKNHATLKVDYSLSHELVPQKKRGFFKWFAR